ncbi:uncharacterized protein LOC127708929 isoform X2 [Mytilus californianus]|uniref:uncharacterized protein LOC127708929 isoform X2 n=1 Tax=Mytilus californianus TaxID=6549 RepID=UPI0022478AA3|nr:uncharacterized protein LOC127708929 isoform X2 [Mytilus californianus]XP_052070078.1 uncharacterized protein LOC127708929 isoform X2 [Mytilus californianus]XP_052070079.1 uncharacterized protein LOC127708929 isoform X2 [Mytilus californianus]
MLPVHVDLTSTWKVCTNAMNAVCDEIPAHVASSDAAVTNTCVIPVPSAEVLTVIKGLLRNDVQDYLKAVIAWSARQHPCSERKEYINLTGTVDDRQNNIEIMHQEDSPSASNFIDDSYDYTSAFNESDIPPLVRRSPRKPNRPTEGDRQNIYPIETASCSYESQPSTSTVTETLRRSPRKNNITTVTQKKSSDRQQMDISDSHQSTASETVSQRSEKLSENVIKDGKMVKLLESHDILVDKDELRKAISAAKKSQKVGYTLCYKLLSSMFSVPEMANSRGQGIGKKKEGDIRQPLKRKTVNTLKDYVIVWCKKNSYTTPTEQLRNDAITERISYARKQLKTPSKKLKR